MEVLLFVNACVLVALLWRIARLARYSRVLHSELELLRQKPHDEAPDLDAFLGKGPRRLLVLDILNPMEVAAQQSWFADKLGSLAAPLIRKIVYDQTVIQIREEVAKYGVRAQVWLHRGA